MLSLNSKCGCCITILGGYKIKEKPIECGGTFASGRYGHGNPIKSINDILPIW